MDKIKKILAPTDLSELSAAGVRYALELGRAVGAAVTVYHAVGTEELMAIDHLRPMPPVLETYDSALARFLENHCLDLLPLVEVHTKVEIGVADINIVDAAAKIGVDLIVISTHGRTGLSHILVGSVTERVVRHARCAVLSIRPERVAKTETKRAA